VRHFPLAVQASILFGRPDRGTHTKPSLLELDCISTAEGVLSRAGATRHMPRRFSEGAARDVRVQGNGDFERAQRKGGHELQSTLIPVRTILSKGTGRVQSCRVFSG
jgi:hypothetical protein